MTNVTFLPLYANGKTSLNLQQEFAHEQKSQMELKRDEYSPNFQLSFDGGGYSGPIFGAIIENDPYFLKIKSDCMRSPSFSQKMELFGPLPLMFWACPEGTLGLRWSEREGNPAASLKAARGAPNTPSSYFRSIVVKNFKVFPEMFIVNS